MIGVTDCVRIVDVGDRFFWQTGRVEHVSVGPEPQALVKIDGHDSIIRWYPPRSLDMIVCPAALAECRNEEERG